MEEFWSKGQSFITWYFNKLNTTPNELEAVYNNDTLVQFNGKTFQGRNEKGKLKILEYLTSPEMLKAKYKIVDYTVQPSIENCILIMVQGYVIPDCDNPKFDQSFDSAFFVHLVSINNSFVILNQVYAISED